MLYSKLDLILKLYGQGSMTLDKENRVIPLDQAPGSKASWTKSPAVIALWILMEYFFVSNPLQVSSRIRSIVLRLFGAEIGRNVIMRPRLRVKYPWNLTIGDNSWIGEGVWIHNQDKVTISNDVCISQETFITTGSHNFRTDMGLKMSPVSIEAGVWVCSRAIITCGTTIQESALIPAGSVVSGNVSKATIYDRESKVPKSRF
jgi:putative colanic acid biosynthesis acetyltransferase WcaF